MNIQISSHESLYLLGESATHPIEPRYGALAALLLVAGICPPPRLALPAHHSAAHSGAFNYRF